jgi:hypothetical protein
LTQRGFLQVTDHSDLQRIEPRDGLDERQCQVDVVASCIRVGAPNMGPVDKILSRFARHAWQRDRQLDYSDDSSVPSILAAIDVQNFARYERRCVQIQDRFGLIAGGRAVLDERLRGYQVTAFVRMII